MSHHDHHHSHHGQGNTDAAATPSDMDKLIKIMEHWISHNEDHAQSYRDWAHRAKDLGSDQVAQILETVAADTLRQNQEMGKALAILRAGHTSH